MISANKEERIIMTGVALENESSLFVLDKSNSDSAFFIVLTIDTIESISTFPVSKSLVSMRLFSFFDSSFRSSTRFRHLAFMIWFQELGSQFQCFNGSVLAFIIFSFGSCGSQFQHHHSRCPNTCKIITLSYVRLCMLHEQPLP